MNKISMKVQVEDIILSALAEDIHHEDISTNAIFTEGSIATVELLAKEEGTLAGLQVFQRTFELLDPATEFEFFFKDGDTVVPGDLVAKIKGDVCVLLSGERVALNFLQRMSGVASYTRKMAREREGTSTKLVDTRKTTPGLRILEKYAVRMGGGHNHRYNLDDAVMLKDNHVLAAGGIAEAIKRARDYTSFVHKVEVEVETIDGVREAVDAGADIIMLDNMTPDQMREAVKYIDGRAVTEASGNISIENIRDLAHLGVDIISSGALTHSALVLDLSMKNLTLL